MNNKSRVAVLLVTSLQFFISVALFIVASFAIESFDIADWAGIVLVALFSFSTVLFVVGIWKVSIYVCEGCGETVSPRFWNWAKGVHVFGKRRLRCSSCNKTTWCKHIAFVKDEGKDKNGKPSNQNNQKNKDGKFENDLTEGA